MVSEITNHPALDKGQDDAAIMPKYGITRIPADHFHLGRYRYSGLLNAVAQAKRAGNKSL